MSREQQGVETTRGGGAPLRAYTHEWCHVHLTRSAVPYMSGVMYPVRDEVAPVGGQRSFVLGGLATISLTL